MIHPQCQPLSSSGTDRAETGLDSHGERLQCGKPVAILGHMPTDALGIPMLDGGKQPAPSFFQGEDPGAIGTPHDVGGRRDDLAGVVLGLSLNNPVRGEQIVLPHETQHPFAADLDPFDEA